jgi:hypothetical protein
MTRAEKLISAPSIGGTADKAAGSAHSCAGSGFS